MRKVSKIKGMLIFSKKDVINFKKINKNREEEQNDNGWHGRKWTNDRRNSNY